MSLMRQPKHRITISSTQHQLLMLSLALRTIAKFKILCTDSVKSSQVVPNTRGLLLNIVLRIYGLWSQRLWIKVEVSKSSRNYETSLSLSFKRIRRNLFGSFRSTSKSLSSTKQENSIFVCGHVWQMTSEFMCSVKVTYEPLLLNTICQTITQTSTWPISACKKTKKHTEISRKVTLWCLSSFRSIWPKSIPNTIWISRNTLCLGSRTSL